MYLAKIHSFEQIWPNHRYTPEIPSYHPHIMMAGDISGPGTVKQFWPWLERSYLFCRWCLYLQVCERAWPDLFSPSRSFSRQGTLTMFMRSKVANEGRRSICKLSWKCMIWFTFILEDQLLPGYKGPQDPRYMLLVWYKFHSGIH